MSKNYDDFCYALAELGLSVKQDQNIHNLVHKLCDDAYDAGYRDAENNYLIEQDQRMEEAAYNIKNIKAIVEHLQRKIK